MTTRVLLVGAGGFAPSHARALRAADGVELVGVVDVDGEAARRLGATQALPWWTDLTEAQQALSADLAAIVTPTSAHADAAITALQAGLHVLIEKPVSLRAEDVPRIRAAAVDRGLLVDVVSQRRFQAGIQRAHDAVSAGAIGAITSAICQSNVWREAKYFHAAPWRGNPAQGGGNLLNQGMHALDLLLWFMGEPRDVVARSKASRVEGVGIDEVIQGVIDFGGPIATMQASLVSKVEPHFQLQLIGDLGSLTVVDREVRLSRWDPVRGREPVETWDAGEVPPALARQYEDLARSVASGGGQARDGLLAGELALRAALAMVASATADGARVSISG